MKTWMKLLVCGMLSFAFLFMTAGYATLTDTLHISGMVNVDVYTRFTVTYMIGDQVYRVDYHTDPETDYTVKGAPDGDPDFKAWVNANGTAVTTIPGYNTNDYVLYATWYNKYSINFIDASGNLIHSEEFTEGATKLSGEGQAIVDGWLAAENARENAKHISVKWSSYDLSSATGNLIVRPQYDYNGYLNLVSVYEQPDDGVVDYYKVVAVDTLPAEVVVPGYVGGIPVKFIERIANSKGENSALNWQKTVTKITVEEGVGELGWNSLAWTPNLEEVYLPNTLERMSDKNVFSRNFGQDDFKVLRITYNGTMAEWKAVLANSHGDWDGGLWNGTVVQCTDGYFKLEGIISPSWKEYPGQTSLELPPDVTEPNKIELIIDGIDDTYIDIWYPVDEQHPVPGDSYEIAFEPAQGYVMAEIISVIIDDTEYVVYTNGYVPAGEVVLTYDPNRNILTIPAELLTDETKVVAIAASAVPREPDSTEESTEEPTEEPTQ